MQSLLISARPTLSIDEIERIIPPKLIPIWQTIGVYYPNGARSYDQYIQVNDCGTYSVPLQLFWNSDAPPLPKLELQSTELPPDLREKLSHHADEMYEMARICGSVQFVVDTLLEKCTTWNQFIWMFPAAKPLFDDSYFDPVREVINKVSRPPRIQPAVTAAFREVLKTAGVALALRSLLPNHIRDSAAYSATLNRTPVFVFDGFTYKGSI
jgi:hypothetical protein